MVRTGYGCEGGLWTGTLRTCCVILLGIVATLLIELLHTLLASLKMVILCYQQIREDIGCLREGYVHAECSTHGGPMSLN